MLNKIQSGVASPAIVLFPASQERNKTFIVLGTPRGGTSMIAGILRHLGVFVGENLDEDTNEDRDFLGHAGDRFLFTDRSRSKDRAAYLRELSRIVKRRSADHAVWGWKDPLASYYVPSLMDNLVNPYFIVVTRDVGAVVQRETYEERPGSAANVFSRLKNTMHEYGQIFDFIQNRARPALLISYERSLRMPSELTAVLARFCGFNASTEQLAWARNFILPDRGTADIATEFRDGFRTSLLGRTASSRIYMEESIRVQQDILGPVPSSTDISDANKLCHPLFEKGAQQLALGDTHGARQSAFTIIQIFARSIPSLADGLLGIVAELNCGAPDDAIFPDVVCGAVYLIGFSFLLDRDAKSALIYLQACKEMGILLMRADQESSTIAQSIFWSCIFHIGKAGKAIGRTDISERAKSTIVEAISGKSWGLLKTVGQRDLEVFGARIASEL